MKAATTIALLASILSVGQTGARIDRGAEHGLAIGDSGKIFYELLVNGGTQRIEVGTARLAQVEAATAQIVLPAGPELRPGFQVEFLIPIDRISSVRSGLGARARPDVAPEPRTEQAPSRQPEEMRFADTILIEQGLYEIGVDLEQADFFNQTPSFRAQLESYLIDSRPVTQREYRQHDSGHVFADGDPDAPATDLTFDEADALCHARGMRLPTEFEWEVGVRSLGQPRPNPIFEWARSWYLPYPGNQRPEESYGRRYRVVRGGRDATAWSPRHRGYLEPGRSEPTVGFRCAAPFERLGD